jgi:hypothetical protein
MSRRQNRTAALTAEQTMIKRVKLDSLEVRNYLGAGDQCPRLQLDGNHSVLCGPNGKNHFAVGPRPLETRQLESRFAVMVPRAQPLASDFMGVVRCQTVLYGTAPEQEIGAVALPGRESYQRRDS